MAADVDGGAIWNEAISVVASKYVRDARTVVPGKVVAVARTTKGEVDVDFDAGIGGRDGGQEKADGQTPEAPVLYPGGGGFSMRWPMDAGDEVVALCSDRSIERWRQNKLVGQSPALSSTRHHDLSDAMILPVRMTPPEAAPTNETEDWILVGPQGEALRVAGAAGTGTVTITKAGAPVATITLDASGSITIAVQAGQQVKLGGDAATLGNARLNDKTSADTAMLAWMTGVQTVTTAAAAFLGIPAPVFPADFGFISQASTKVVSE